MSSIFSRIFKYRPRVDRLPKEDFFTEAFAGVLQTNSSLCAAFAKWLICLCHDFDSVSIDVDSVTIETQKTFASGDRLDVWIVAHHKNSGARHVVAMENKIGAAEGQNQLQRYEDILRREEASADTRTLVYATLHERTNFEPRRDGPEIGFLPIRWFYVADWMRKWVAESSPGVEDRSIVLVRELVQLMEDWNMAMNLTRTDLEAAFLYRNKVRSVEAQLIRILDETEQAYKQAHDLDGDAGNTWYRSRIDLIYQSPYIDIESRNYIEFGFDFDRDDDDWRASQPSLPSAYFAANGGWPEPDIEQLRNVRNWVRAPYSWGDGYRLVKRLGHLDLQGDSLHGEYLDFFRVALDELLQALNCSR